MLAEKKIDRSLLPAGSSGIEIQREQAMSLPGEPTLALLPVRYKTPNGGGGGSPTFHCGVFLAMAGEGNATFVETFGTDWTETESCVTLAAIGAADRASHPSLILIYTASTGRGSFPEPVLLTWDTQSSTYRPDAERSQWLGQQKDGHTVAGARRLIASHPRDKPGDQ